MKPDLLEAYRRERERLLGDITRLLDRDPQVKAAWLAGSLGRGDGDALSDIDLFVVVDDAAIEAIIAAPRQMASLAGDVILYVEAPQNAPQGGVYLMAGYDAPVAPHLVDWYWQPLSRAYISRPVRILIDRIGLPRRDEPVHFSCGGAQQEIVEQPAHFISFFWMMLLITAKQVYRSPWAKKIELLPFLIDPLVKAQQISGLDRFLLIEEIPSHRLPDEKIRLLFRLADQMSAQMTALAEKGKEVPSSSLQGAYRFLKLIESAVKAKNQQNDL